MRGEVCQARNMTREEEEASAVAAAAAPPARATKQQDDKETNDNTHNGPAAAASQLPTSSEPAAGQSPPGLPQPPPPKRQARPARPNHRARQLMVDGARPSLIGGGPPIELAAGVGMVVPPKRPAHLPARYDTFSRSGGLAAGGDGSGGVGLAASSKPNRYSYWAQMQSNWRSQPAGEPGGPGPFGPLHPHPAGHQHHHHHFSPAGMLVVNPMRIVNLSEHTKSRLVKIIEALKRFSEQWFSHVLLLLFLALYACFGAYIFISFEAPTERWEKQLIIDTRQRLLNESWPEAKALNRTEFVDLFRAKLEEYERLLNRACSSGMTSSSLEDQWTFWGALFYSMTVFTTIGYGHLTPITFAGRVATMIYAIFGIPILLMVLADLGKLLTRIIKFAFKQSRSLYNKLLHKKTSIRTRKMISDNTNHAIGAARGAFERGYAHLQPYNKLPQAFARATSFRRRFQRAANKDPEQAAAGDASCPAAPPDATGLNHSGSDTTASTNASQATPQDQQVTGQPEQSVDLAAAAATGSKTTDVIVTPVKQTKPVSPQTNDRRHQLEGVHEPPAQQQQANHHHHSHHSHHHHQHRPAGHHGGGGGARAQSPGTQTPGKRKISLCSASRGKAGPAQGASAPKERVSRSSSVTSSQAQNGEQKANSKQPQTLESQLSTGEPIVGDAGEEKLKSAASDLDPTEPPMGSHHATTAAATDFDDDVADEMVEDMEEDEDDIQDEFDIPVSFALFLLVTYMMFGAVVFSIWEGWNFFDSLYFVFISMSTIGFGDLVPQHPKRMIGTFIYLLFGLALTSMCINVVQEKIHATFLRAKMQIGEKMGLDLDQIMADDYYDGSTLECDEDDLNSMANSQTNSSQAYQMCLAADAANGGDPLAEPDNHKLDSPTGGEGGVKQSRSRDSLKAKRRLITGLPAHSGSSGPMLRRSQSKKLQRQVTPSVSGHAAVADPHQAAHHQTNSHQQPAVVKSELLEATQRTMQFTPVADITPAINQPAKEVARGLCEPLQLGASQLGGGSRSKLVASKSDPTSSSDLRIPKSLSSETGFTNLAPTLAETARGVSGGPPSPGPAQRRPSTAFGSKEHRLGQQPLGGRRSADSSRRSSVSQELNQLDDLIKKLSSGQLADERFGPLLGIPSSRRSSRASNATSSNSINSGSGLANKRGTSMINRPIRFQANTPQSAAAAASSSFCPNTNLRVKKTSLAGLPSSSAGVSASFTATRPPPTNSTSRRGSKQETLEAELGAIKFSAV